MESFLQWYENSKKLHVTEDINVILRCYGLTQDIYNNISDVYEKNYTGDWESMAQGVTDSIEKLQSEILKTVSHFIYEELSIRN